MVIYQGIKVVVIGAWKMKKFNKFGFYTAKYKKENHVTSIPVGMRLCDKVKDTWQQCDLYKKEEPNRHCRDMKCDGHKLYFCWTYKKGVDYTR